MKARSIVVHPENRPANYVSGLELRYVVGGYFTVDAEVFIKGFKTDVHIDLDKDIEIKLSELLIELANRIQGYFGEQE